MRLTKIEIENFRCFKQLSVNFCTNNTPDNPSGKGGMTVFVAANGQGKTAILEAVKYLLAVFISRFPKTSVPRLQNSDFRDEWYVKKTYNKEELVAKPRAPYMRLMAETEFPVENKPSIFSPVKWDIVQKRDKSAQTLVSCTPIGTKQIYQQADWFIDHDNIEQPLMLPIIAYYNTERAVIRNKPERRRGFQKAFNRYDSYAGALDAGLNYKKIIEWFCYLEDKQRREKEIVRNWDYQSLEHRTIQLAVEKMLPGFSNLRTTLSPLDLIVDVKEDNTTVKTCRIDSQLSDGYKIVLVLVLDLVSRILEANAIIDGITPEKLLQSEGIVLIDEIDLHLHPSWQQRIIGDLQRTFPNIQFIVTTHSPQVVSSVHTESIRIVDNNQVKTAIGSEGGDSSRILDDIFGTKPFPENNEMRKKLDRYLDLVYAHKWKSENAVLLRRELDSVYQGKEPLLTDADLFIENEEWEEAHNAPTSK